MECMSTIRLRVSVRLAHRAQVLAAVVTVCEECVFLCELHQADEVPDRNGVHLDTPVMEEPAQAVRALEGVSDMPGELGCARQAPKLGFDPGPQGLDDRRREFLSDLKPVLRWMAAHHGLYPGQRRDASEYLLAHGRRRAALELHKPSPPVDPTVCEIPWVGDPSRIAERVVTLCSHRHAAGRRRHSRASVPGRPWRCDCSEWWNSTIGGSGTAMAALIAGDRPQIVETGLPGPRRRQHRYRWPRP